MSNTHTEEDQVMQLDRRIWVVLGLFFELGALFIGLSLVSYVFFLPSNSQVSGLDKDNWMGAIGAQVAHFLMTESWGLNGFFIPFFPLLIGHKIANHGELTGLLTYFIGLLLFMAWSTLLIGYFYHVYQPENPYFSILPGYIGETYGGLLYTQLGMGTLLVLTMPVIALFVFYFDITALHELFPSEEEEASPPSFTQEHKPKRAREESSSAAFEEEEEE